MMKYVTAALAMLAAIAAAFGFQQKAKRLESERDASESARNTEHKAADAALKGVEREHDEVEKAVSRRRDRLAGK